MTDNNSEPGLEFMPIAKCKVQTGGRLSCSLITDGSCDHSMYLGVVCGTCEQLYNELLDECSSTSPPPPCPTCDQPPPCPTREDPTQYFSECPTEAEATCDCPATEEQCSNTLISLGAVVCLLLVATAISWTVTCVVCKRRSDTHKQRYTLANLSI